MERYGSEVTICTANLSRGIMYNLRVVVNKTVLHWGLLLKESNLYLPQIKRGNDYVKWWTC